ncbi:Heterogeneous nuclear ribonucleoprotein D-like [Lemmus lemmus]
MEDMNEYSNIEEFSEGSKINANKDQQDDGHESYSWYPQLGSPYSTKAGRARLEVLRGAAGSLGSGRWHPYFCHVSGAGQSPTGAKRARHTTGQGVRTKPDYISHNARRASC